MDYTICLKYFIGLVAIINPIGLLPVFSTLTSGNSPRERLQINITANIAVGIILIVSLFLGGWILDIFSISIDSFRIAGGIMITLIALVMVQGQLESGRNNADETAEAKVKNSIAVVPLAMPLMAGPGAISSTIVFSSHFGSSVMSYLGGMIVIMSFAVFSFLVFLTSSIMLRLLGTTGVNIVTRIMGIIMLSIGIEMIATGLKGLFYIEKFVEYISQ